MLPFTKRESHPDGTERTSAPAAAVSTRPRPPVCADDDEMTRVLPSRSALLSSSRERALSMPGLGSTSVRSVPLPPSSTPALSFTPPSGIAVAPASLAPMVTPRASTPSIPAMSSISTPGSFAGFDPPAAVLTQSGVGSTGARATLALGAGIAAIALLTAFAALLIVLRGAHGAVDARAAAAPDAPELAALPTATAPSPAALARDPLVVPAAADTPEVPSVAGVSTGSAIVPSPDLRAPAAPPPAAPPPAAAAPAAPRPAHPPAIAAAPKAPRAPSAQPAVARKPAAPAGKPRPSAAREEMDRAREAKELADRQLADAL